MGEKVLIVDDEQEIADLVAVYLESEGYEVYKFYTAKEALACIKTTELDLAILDVMLPQVNGFTICQKIRKKYHYPVIMLTAKDEEIDKITGLTLGADDYITKPFHIRELIARIKAVLRRNTNTKDTNILTYSDLKLDLSTGKMSSKDIEIPINGKELNLLEILLLNQKQIVDREMLANKIWGVNSEAEYNNVEVYISFLRRKLKLLKSKVKIKAIRGIGYKLEEVLCIGKESKDD